MVAQQVTFTNLPLRQYVDGWKAAMQGKDAQIQITESSLADGSLVVEYTSLPFQETAIRRFIQCSDGIYALAYHVRPQLRDEGKYKIWLHIIDTASVIPNPKAAAATHPENPQEVWFADFLRKHGGKDFYPPHDATINSLMQVVQDYYKAHPELGGKLMENQILQALIEKYPTPVTSP